MPTFLEKLSRARATAGSLLCVGLDPDPARLPGALGDLDLPDAILAFNNDIIDATSQVACAYKLNLAFYEALGSAGWRVMERTLLRIPSHCIVIADGKRGDIGNSAVMYARSVFDTLPFDACTVSPYMGLDSVKPFLEFDGRAAFVLCLTSNPGSSDFQKLMVDGKPLYRRVAEQAESWAEDVPGTAGLVVGATHPGELAELRRAHPSMPFLIPGVGAQGGSMAEVIRAAVTETGPALINVGREILYASSGDDYGKAAKKAASVFQEEMESALTARRE